MTRLTPGAIVLRTIALSSAVTISACLVVREQDRADQASAQRQESEQSQEQLPTNPAPEGELAGPELPVSDEEIFLHTSKAFAPPEALDPSIFLSTSKSAVIDVPPEVFLPSSKSLTLSPGFIKNAREGKSDAEMLLLDRQEKLQAQLEQVRLELESLRARQEQEKQANDKED